MGRSVRFNKNSWQSWDKTEVKQGQYQDDETGLHYNRHRYYDPQTGRFMSKVPIGLVGGIHVFSFGANPIDWIDPLGLAEKPVAGHATVVRGGESSVENLKINQSRDERGHVSCNVETVSLENSQPLLNHLRMEA